MAKKKIRVALAGNPNSGKTSIFNALTGAHQKVGNYPGVTVEKRVGYASYNGYELEFVDLPGTYSLNAYSTDEKVARDFLIDFKPDVVINVIDSGNLERNLYLTTQLLELECDIIIDLNMWDEAQRMGIHINTSKLSRLLGAPIVTTIGHRGSGTADLLRAAVDLVENRHLDHRHAPVTYGSHIEDLVVDLTRNIEKCKSCELCPSKRWLAVKLLEGDIKTESKFIRDTNELDKLQKSIRKKVRHVKRATGEDPEVILTDGRYGYISGIMKEVVTHKTGDRMRQSRQIDAILTHRFLGYPIFLFLIWLVFQATFVIGNYPMEWIEYGVSILGSAVDNMLPDGFINDLIVDGAIAGSGSVLVFLPNIMILFLGIAALEDSGYMARAAFLMDRLMHALGLHGKSFIPMIMGFGCNVPAIMATRTLESERDRIMTILLIPLMSCSARLAVYVLFAGAFFGAMAGNVIFAIYLLGIAAAVGIAQILRKTLFRQEVAPFVMELPPYRIPTIKSVVIHMWERASIYLKKIGGIILIASVIIWLLGYIPKPEEYSQDYGTRIENLQLQLERAAASEQEEQQIRQELSDLQAGKSSEEIQFSYIGRIGKGVEPAIEPLGFDWRLGVSLITGFVAKEIVISTLGVLYQIGEEETEESTGLTDALRDPRSNITPLTSLAFMVFVLLYTPCIATILAIKREAGLKIMFLSVAYQLILAWSMAFVVYQGGKLLGFS
ncbi:MAG TPA: ferrous iron transport protein B [candidate division Zixibacteria bacterium]|nr:ferrous iron transport protein B [candidate division Zixibacteria bacterium]